MCKSRLTLPQAERHESYTGECFGFPWQRVMDGAHFLSAGVVSFARGLNDTPKIAAMLFGMEAFDIRWGRRQWRSPWPSEGFSTPGESLKQ